MKFLNELTRYTLAISNIVLILFLGALGLFGLYKRAFWHKTLDRLAADRDRDIDNLLRCIILPDTSEYDALDDFGKTTLLREWCHNNISTTLRPGDSSVNIFCFPRTIENAWGGRGERMYSEILKIYEVFDRPIKPDGWNESEIR